MNNLPNESHLIPINEASKLLHVSYDTLRRWDKKGILKAVRDHGKSRYYRLSDIELFKSTKPITIKEASNRLRISISTLRRLEKKGMITPDRGSNGRRLFYPKDLEIITGQPRKIIHQDALQKIYHQDKKSVNNTYKHFPYGYGKAFSTGFILFPIFVIYIFIMFTLFFLAFPDKAIEAVEQSKINESRQRVLGTSDDINKGSNILANIMRPIGSFSLELLKSTNPSRYRELIPEKETTDISDLFRIDSEGNLLPIQAVKFDPANTFLITDKKLVDNLNADYLRGFTPGAGPNSLAIIDENGNLILEGGLMARSISAGSYLGQEATSERIKDRTISAEDIALDSLTSELIKDGEIKEEDIAKGAVSHDKLSDETVGEENLKNNSVTEGKLAEGSVTGLKIAANTISTDDLEAALVFSGEDFLDLSQITHSSISPQGLRLPNVTSSAPANPSEGEGYIAWDKSNKRLIYYDGSQWKAVGSPSSPAPTNMPEATPTLTPVESSPTPTP